MKLVDFGDLANSDETLAFLTSKSQVCSSFDLTYCQMQALRKVCVCMGRHVPWVLALAINRGSTSALF